MDLKNFKNEDEFYGQGFEKDGLVSIWLGLDDEKDDLDVLQDLCGVGYYNIDNQEMNVGEKLEELNVLLENISYSDSFKNKFNKVAKEKGLSKAKWILLQYDFDYNPNKIKSKISNDPVFIGSFEYSDDE
jgi:hypothetical protein